MSHYIGSCHCQTVKFTIDCDPIVKGVKCNCSICRRKQAVMSEPYYPPEQIEVVGTESLTKYLWGDCMVNHWFCKVCGIHPFHDVIGKEGAYRVNLGCVDGLDTGILEVRLIDGASF